MATDSHESLERYSVKSWFTALSRALHSWTTKTVFADINKTNPSTNKQTFRKHRRAVCFYLFIFFFFLHLFRNDKAGDNLGILDPYSFRHKTSHTPTAVTTSQHSELIWPALLVRINTTVRNKVSSSKCHLEGDQLFPIVRFVYSPSASSFTNFCENNRKTSWSLQVLQMHFRQTQR